jgi:hypothetical protein
MFQLYKTWEGPVALLPLALAEQANEDKVVSAVMRPMSAGEKLYKSLSVRRRLDSRCKDLLEVKPIRRNSKF